MLAANQREIICRFSAFVKLVLREAKRGAERETINIYPSFSRASSFDREILRISERDKLHVQSLQSASSAHARRRAEASETGRRAGNARLVAAPLGRKSYE